MTHHENNGRVTHFCYQYNEILDNRDADSLGRHHFPNGSFNDCINTINGVENNLEEFYINSDYYTECNYSTSTQEDLEDHLYYNDHYEKFYCT